MERSCEIQLQVEAAKLEKNYVGEEAAKITHDANADPVGPLISFLMVIAELTLATGSALYGVPAGL
jgi:hypothetical protein